MSETGYSSLGHLFEFESEADHKEIFRKVLGRVQITVGETNIHRTSEEYNKRISQTKFVPFDEYFKNTEINIGSCHSFIITMLKHYNVVDALTYELKIEKAVWSILKENKKWFEMHNRYGNLDEGGMTVINMNDATVYRIFCIFNRFSQSKDNKVRLDPANQKILLEKFKKVLASPQKSEDFSTFCGVLQYVHKHKDSFVTISVKEVYDKFVRDVLREGRVKFQLKTITVKNSSNGKMDLKVKVGKNF